MVNGSYFRFDDDIKIVDAILQSPQEKCVRWKLIAQYIAWIVFDLIWDKHSTEYTWQAFICPMPSDTCKSA